MVGLMWRGFGQVELLYAFPPRTDGNEKIYYYLILVSLEF